MRKLILFLCLAFVVNLAEAQILRKSFEVYSLSQGTLTNAGTLTFEAGYLIPDVYDLSWQVEVDSVSGTPAKIKLQWSQFYILLPAGRPH